MPKPSIFTSIWRFLISLRLTLFLLFILAGACIIGTVVPQKATQAEYIGIFGETGLRVIEACLLYDLFGSWWFQLTMAFFALNLICCTLHRAPRIWHALRSGRALPDSAGLAAMSCRKTVRLQNFDSADEERFAHELSAAFGRPVIPGRRGYPFCRKGALVTAGIFAHAYGPSSDHGWIAFGASRL
jgi:cytochrome c biogenesis protein